MPKQDRGAPARPPWLPDEDDRRSRGIFARRRKSDDSDDPLQAADPDAEADEVPEYPAAPEGRIPLGGGWSEDSETNTLENKGISAPSILTAQLPPPADPPSTEPELPDSQASSSEVMGVVDEPKDSLTDAAPSASRPVLEEHFPDPVPDGPPVVAERAEPQPEADALPEAAATSAEPKAIPTREAETAHADPFSRFSELEAKLRQTHIEESMPEWQRNAVAASLVRTERPLAETADATTGFATPELVEGVEAEPLDHKPDSELPLASSEENRAPDLVAAPSASTDEELAEKHHWAAESEVGEADRGAAENIVDHHENIADYDDRAAEEPPQTGEAPVALTPATIGDAVAQPVVADSPPVVTEESRITEQDETDSEELSAEQGEPAPVANPIEVTRLHLLAAEPPYMETAPAFEQSAVEPPAAVESAVEPPAAVESAVEPPAAVESAVEPLHTAPGVVMSAVATPTEVMQPPSAEVAEPPLTSDQESAGSTWPVPAAVQLPPQVEQPAYPAPTQQPVAQVPPVDWNQAPQGPMMQGPIGQPNPEVPQGQHLPPGSLPPQAGQGQWHWVPQHPSEGLPPTPYPQPTAQPMHPQLQSQPGFIPPPHPNAPPGNFQIPQGYGMPPSLDEAEIINRGRYAPKSGWRRAVHRATGGYLNPGDSPKERKHDALLAAIRQPILGDYRVAVLSIKGGVGKTTTTLGLGSAFAAVRTDRIIAVDANPDRGTLAERVRDPSTFSTVRDLLKDERINSYADVRNHTRMATSRLEVLASEQDPAVSEAYGEVDYRNTIDILQRYYNIILTDCGTGIMHSAMTGVLDLAHAIVLVSSPAMDAARSASATLDWLVQHGYSGLVQEAHVVLSASRPGSAGIKLDKVYEHFQARCKSIHMVPFDPHLAEGADVEFNRLNPETNEAYLELAAAIAQNFPRLRSRDEWR